MRTFRGAWSVAGLVAGFAGLATSYCVAMVMTIRDSPVTAVAELVIRLTPGPVAERAIGVLGHQDKLVLLLIVLLLSALLFAWAGRLARRTWWAPTVLFAVLAVLGGIAVALQHGATALDVLPVAVGWVTWLLCLALLTGPLRRQESAAAARAGAGAATSSTTSATSPATEVLHGGTPAPGDHSRRSFLLRAGAIGAAAVVLGTVGRVVGSGRRHVEETRRLLRLPGVTSPRLPDGVQVHAPGMTPWTTSSDDFYRIDTAIVVPTIEPADWQLRIHGMVDRELVLSYRELIAHRLTQSWITLNCVSNEVGGDLIGNAWWSGVRVADLLELAGVQEGADAVLQTSQDGWTCGTPLGVLTDDRNAMLAVAMNGRPLPIVHGFPVRTVVPGLYGYVSACKWVVEMKVTRFADISAYWTDRGWSELGPVKVGSRIDVPRSGGEVNAVGGRIAGVAWAQHTGIEAVEISVDGGAWTAAQLARVPNADTWVQWVAILEVEPGDHTVKVRATTADGQVQTGVERDVVPDGATGWHTIDLSATAPAD